ncbi:alpha/beta hydrolase [Riemerella columbipharyngis]|uniref:Phospholipase/carboxylesterase n=1 Tax=Riemerella columbipharyngis TaxID=1071918 RepID=A0A1G7ARI1_9FLAO|nr:alpha/beta hydrolase-fold protein [Riemerella columbipharyngis]SDE16526.1 phospholipase/carboxylesterase [Riemerella columbipharyngis]
MDIQYLIKEPNIINKNTPLLVLIHGYGSNEEDLFSFVPTLPEEWLIISLRAPKTTVYGGYAWYDIDFVNSEKFINTEQANLSIQAIIQTVKQVRERYGNTEGDIHLCGFSQGAILSYAMALTYPDMFQKIACLSGYPEMKILTNIVKDKKKIERLRFFISHGTDDAVIPLEWARKAADLLYDIGAYFTFREYMSGHGVNQKNYQDLMEFFRS